MVDTLSICIGLQCQLNTMHEVKSVGFKLSEILRLRSCPTQQDILHNWSCLNSRSEPAKYHCLIQKQAQYERNFRFRLEVEQNGQENWTLDKMTFDICVCQTPACWQPSTFMGYMTFRSPYNDRKCGLGRQLQVERLNPCLLETADRL